MIDSPFIARDSKVLSGDPRFLGGSGSSAAIRTLRSAVTAVIALSLGIALVSWLKGGEEARPSGTSAALSATSTSVPMGGRMTRTR